MTPASRTPEGESNQCPVCGNEVRLEPSRPPGDAPCPCCGHLLWFASPSPSVKVLSAEAWNDLRFQLWASHVAKAPDDRYLVELISGLAMFMAARRGAVWMLAGKQLKRTADYREEATFPETMSDRERANELLQRVAASGQSLVSQPIQDCCLDKGTQDSLLLAVPVIRNMEIVAIVELAQEPGATIELQRSNLRFIEKICALASERIGRVAHAAPIPEAATPVSSSKSIGKKRWWQVWKKP